jgi:hypothetical protein
VERANRRRGADKFGRQRGILFERAANVRTRFNLAEEMKQRPEGMKASGKELKAQPIRCFPALAERGIRFVELPPKALDILRPVHRSRGGGPFRCMERHITAPRAILRLSFAATARRPK